MAYQVCMEDPGMDGHRWWAGYPFTFPTPVALYPPRGPGQTSWDLPSDLKHSHHDQGGLHAPLYIDAIADPELLDRLLDMDLGWHTLTPRGRTTFPFQGRNVVGFLNSIATSR